MTTIFNAYYTYSQLKHFINEVAIGGYKFIPSNKYGEMLNVPIAFDIETSSFYDENGDKRACMYSWAISIDFVSIWGRTWKEFHSTINAIKSLFNLNSTRWATIYVHNLGYEFQFLQHRFNWDYVFSSKKRRPIFAECNGIVFKDSYILSGVSLDYIGKNMLLKYNIKKQTGKLDYYKIRHSQSTMTPDEIEYQIADVNVLVAYIKEKMEQDGNITKIPLTKTGYVRNYVRNACLTGAKNQVLNYRAIMKTLNIQDEREYNLLKRAFRGGFTHASLNYSNKVIKNVGSADIASSYPYQMVSNYFPMGKGERVFPRSHESFKEYLNKYCCIFDIEFNGLESKIDFESYLSSHNSQMEGDYSLNNGRIIRADKLRTTLTEVDFSIVSQVYVWDDYKISNLIVYPRGYLPIEIIKATLKMYKDKTELKGIQGKEVEYLISKTLINAAFGMMVTSIIRDDHIYENNEWSTIEADVNTQLRGYNASFQRFLSYAWGIYVTAHARRALWDAIIEFGQDYVYSDTDSVKGLNFNSHLKWVQNYNSEVYSRLLKVSKFYSIPLSDFMPLDKKGKKHCIGVWEIEDSYIKFKTVGAKRYLYKYADGFVNMTVSGVNKTEAMPYLIAKWNNIDIGSSEYELIKSAYKGDYKARTEVCKKNYRTDGIFFEFGDMFYIPPEHTGKLTMTYVDTSFNGALVDYQGVISEVSELSYIHAEPQHFSMSLADDYLHLLNNMHYVEF